MRKACIIYAGDNLYLYNTYIYFNHNLISNESDFEIKTKKLLFQELLRKLQLNI